MDDQFRLAVANLHREKNAAYGDAWKKRGEVMSVLANLARKIDRLVAGTTTRDESALDTAVDLLVYAIKYETFLADLDPTVANTLFDQAVPAPYSDGIAGFEARWDNVSQVDTHGLVGVNEATADVERTFGDLERQFDMSTPHASTADRAARAAALTRAAAVLLSTITRGNAPAAVAFIDTWKDPHAS